MTTPSFCHIIFFPFFITLLNFLSLLMCEIPNIICLEGRLLTIMLQRSIHWIFTLLVVGGYHDITTPKIPNPHHLHVDFYTISMFTSLQVVKLHHNMKMKCLGFNLCIHRTIKMATPICMKFVASPLTNYKELQIIPHQQMEEVNEYNEQVIFWNLC